jgi:hypothetical protein
MAAFSVHNRWISGRFIRFQSHIIAVLCLRPDDSVCKSPVTLLPQHHGCVYVYPPTIDNVAPYEGCAEVDEYLLIPSHFLIVEHFGAHNQAWINKVDDHIFGSNLRGEPRGEH